MNDYNGLTLKTFINKILTEKTTENGSITVFKNKTPLSNDFKKIFDDNNPRCHYSYGEITDSNIPENMFDCIIIDSHSTNEWMRTDYMITIKT